MIKLVTLLVCVAVATHAEPQRPGFIIPVQLSQQQIQSGPYYVHVSPFRRPVNRPLPFVVPSNGFANYPGFYRLPAGLPNSQQFRPTQPAYYLVPANAIPAQQNSQFVANKFFRAPEAAPQITDVPAENDEECQEDESEIPAVELVEGQN